MGDFQKDFMNVVENRGKGDIADAVGMPDEKDYEVLSKIFRRFERKKYQYIINDKPVVVTGKQLLNYSVQSGRRDYEEGIHSRNKIWTGKATVNKTSNMNYVFELPSDLYHMIEAVFPSMFRSRKHFAWFKKNFQRLTITGEDR